MRRSSRPRKFATSIIMLAAASVLVTCSEEPSTQAEQIDPQVDQIARGEYIALAVGSCHGCHSEDAANPDATEFRLSGRDEGAFVAPNITQDMETGIGAWSDAEIENALRKGQRPDGTSLHPVMPWKFYAHLTQDDMSAMIAWLRTQDAVSNALPRKPIGFPLRIFSSPPAPLAAEDVGEVVARGSYLTAISHCLRCHTPPGPDGPLDYDNQLGAGGFPMGSPDAPVVSANLTSHPDDGVAHYTDAELAALIKTGVRPDGSRLSPPMGPRRKIIDSDMQAIVAYLRTLPALPYPTFVPDLQPAD